MPTTINQFMMETINTSIIVNYKITKKPEFKIVGIHKHGSGCFCFMHSHCVMQVAVGDVLWLVCVFVTTSDSKEPKEAVKAVKIIDGLESCTVSSISQQAFTWLERISGKIGNFCVVLDLYDNSNKNKQILSKKNHGVASCFFLNAVPWYEWWEKRTEDYYKHQKKLFY